MSVNGLAQGTITVNAAAPGDFELDSLSDFQIRFDKDIPLGGSRRLRLSLDLFNLFNADTPTSVRQLSNQSVPFLTTTDIFLPRRAQIGVRFDF